MGKRKLKPRPNLYDNAEVYRSSDSQVPRGDHVLNQTLTAINLQFPSWSSGHPLVFRAWPGLQHEDPSKLAPGRKSVEPRGQSHWFVWQPVARQIGIHPDQTTFATHYVYEKHKRFTHVYYRFWNACASAIDAEQKGPGRRWDADWNWLVLGKRGEKKSAKPISPPTKIGLIQGHVYANGKEEYIARDGVPLGAGENDPLVVIQLTFSCAERLLNALDTELPDCEGDLERYPWLKFRYGDVVGQEHKGEVADGSFIYVFNPAEVKTITKNTTWDKQRTKGYEVAFSRKYVDSLGRVHRPSLTAEMVERIKDRWQFWFPTPQGDEPGLLEVPPEEEQAVLIAQAFRSYPKLIEFAMPEEYVTDDVLRIIRSRRSESVPPGVPEAGYESLGQQDADGPRRPRIDPSQLSTVDDDDEYPSVGKPVRRESLASRVPAAPVETNYSFMSPQELGLLAANDDRSAQLELETRCPANLTPGDYDWAELADIIAAQSRSSQGRHLNQADADDEFEDEYGAAGTPPAAVGEAEAWGEEVPRSDYNEEDEEFDESSASHLFDAGDDEEEEEYPDQPSPQPKAPARKPRGAATPSLQDKRRQEMALARERAAKRSSTPPGPGKSSRNKGG